MAKDETAGAWAVNVTTWLGGALKNLFVACLIATLVLGCVVPDMWLGREFIEGESVNQGNDQVFPSWLIPWCLSVVTSGFQYLVYQRLGTLGGWKGADKHDKIAIALALSVAVMDTLMDAGGMTRWLYHQDEFGIFPDVVTWDWWAAFVIVIFVCGFHEVFLVPLLFKEGKKQAARVEGTPGAWMVQGVIKLLGALFGLWRGGAIMLTVVVLFSLDFLLGPEFLNTATPWPPIVAYVISGMMSGAQALFYRAARESRLTKWMYIGIGIAVVDTFMDTTGITSYLYNGQLTPPTFTFAWLMTQFMVFVLCGFGEWIAEGLLSRRKKPKKTKKKKGKKKDKGIDDIFGDDPFGGMDFGTDDLDDIFGGGDSGKKKGGGGDPLNF